MPKLKTFTVIGVYSENGQVYADEARAIDAYAAIGVIARRAKRAGNGSDLEIVCAIEGRPTLVSPGCDNGKTAYADDCVAL